MKRLIMIAVVALMAFSSSSFAATAQGMVWWIQVSSDGGVQFTLKNDPNNYTYVQGYNPSLTPQVLSQLLTARAIGATISLYNVTAVNAGALQYGFQYILLL